MSLDARQVAYMDWVKTRPPKVREVAEKFLPWHLYKIKSTGHIVELESFGEPKDDSPVTLTVLVLNRNNPKLAFERRVFGVKPEDLEKVDEAVH